MSAETPANELRCSFCNKSQRHVMTLIAGPAVCICNECVDICASILAEKEEQKREELRTFLSSPGSVVACALCRMPLDTAEALVVSDRGAVCPGCVGEFEAALAERQTVQ